MRISIALAAPLVLALAACGETTPADEVTPEPMPTAEVPVELPTIPVNSTTTVQYSGSYSQAGADGEIRRLTLNEDNTYEYTTANGQAITGTYSRMEDGSRIRLEDFEGGPAWFSVGNGAIYRLPSESTPYNEITMEGEYRRDVSQMTPPGATPATGTAAAPAAVTAPADPS
ncbi:hypothetical protein [Altericroceibacterium xinjiangense]|uniref:hypothetical protein n=1 Tax=Altericroceibacterium xinjiangense TaxID=762261 RepID=UPI000F7DEE3A|nr:hypothetical protein [Altericroceibacterium xinjiangense]